MKSVHQTLALIFFILFTQPAYSQSQRFSMEVKPVWEAGIGAGYINSVDYPGSTDRNKAQFALPYFIYRSDLFRVGDGGVGAIAVEEPRIKLDVSLGGALNAESEPGSVREGMPDLDLLFEFGPRLQLRIIEKRWDNGSRSRLDWDSKVRAVAGTNFKGVKARGFVFSTGLAFRQRAIAGDKIDLILNTDITFADRRYNDYLYSVSTQFATDQRALYQARPGYVESRAFVGLAFRPIPTLRIFTGFALFSYANAANEAITLFEADSSTQYAIGMAWSALRSKKTISIFSSE